jgi:hypothetical protein
VPNQPTKEFLGKVLDWFNEDPTHRAITIRDTADFKDDLTVWFYDYRLQTGAYGINTIPDLQAVYDQKQRADYEKLKQRFEREEVKTGV